MARSGRLADPANVSRDTHLEGSVTLLFSCRGHASLERLGDLGRLLRGRRGLGILLGPADGKPEDDKEAKGGDGAERARVEGVGAENEARVLVVPEGDERDGLRARQERPAGERRSKAERAASAKDGSSTTGASAHDPPGPLVVNEELEDAVPVGRLEVRGVLGRARAGALRDRVEVGPNVGVEHRKVELEVRQPDRRPDARRRLEGLDLDLVRLVEGRAWPGRSEMSGRAYPSYVSSGQTYQVVLDAVDGALLTLALAVVGGRDDAEDA